MNQIVLAGTIFDEPTFSHIISMEKFYTFKIAIKRLSDTIDILDCICSEVFLTSIAKDNKIQIVGELRTRNIEGRCELKVFVNEVNEYNQEVNEMSVNGFICKPPIYRTTPKGRYVTDVIIACNRQNIHKSDYIPSVVWGRNAIRMSKLNVGQEVNMYGRLQSREYVKHYEDGTQETKVAYEFSVSSFEEAN